MAESMEDQKIIQNVTPCPKSDNQYDNLTFGGASNLYYYEPSINSSNISNFDSSQNAQDNIVFINQSLTAEQLEMLNNSNIVIDKNPVEMDKNEVRNESEEEQARFPEMLINEQNSDAMHNNNSTPTEATQSHGNIQSFTTDNTCSDVQYMNMFDYCCQLLGKLNLIVDELKPVLINLNTSAEDAGCLLENLQISFSQYSNMAFQMPLETFADVLQLSCRMLHESRQVHSAYSIAEELDETTEQRIAAPNDENEDQSNEQLRSITESNLPTSSIPKDTCLVTLSLSLSQLLSQARHVVQELELVELKIVEQPQEFWRKRSINCLRNKWCPAIQGRSGKQRHYIGIKWSKLTNCNPNTLFILIQLLSFDNEPHPSNVLVPAGTTIKLQESFGKKRKNDNIRPKLDDLIIKEKHGFDKKTKAILCPVTEKEYKECKKNLNVIMFRLYKTSEEIANSDDEETEENENHEEDISIEEQLHKLSKLRICLCRQTDKGELEYVSNFVVTDLIEESKGNKSLAVDPSKVTPEYLCNCGNETITVLFNTDSEKNGLVVHLNDEKLDAYRIRGVTKKQIFFNSRPNTIHGQNYLNVKVSKKSISETIKQNHDPYNGLDENILLNMNINYVEKSENPHVHKDINTTGIFNPIE